MRFWMVLALSIGCGSPCLVAQSNSALTATVPSSAVPIIGATTETVTLPISKTSQLGFGAEVTLGLHDSAGSVPVHIRVDSASVFAADRELIFRFSSDIRGQYPPTNRLTVDVPVRLSQGDNQATEMRYMPKWTFGMSYTLEILERPGPDEPGRLLKDCTAEIASARTGPILASLMDTDVQINSVLIVDTDRVDFERLPDLRSLFFLNVRDSILEQSRPPSEAPLYWSSLLTLNTAGRGLSVVGQAELPSDWRAYQYLDLIVLNHDALARTKRGGHFASMRNFVMSGGAILLYDAESEQQWIESFQLTAKPTTDVVAIQKDVVKLIQGSPERFGRSESEEPLWARSLGMGYVFGIPNVDQSSQPSFSPARSAFPSALSLRTIDLMLGHRRSPMLRRGVDPILGDSRYRNWLIPGIAEPPVYTFMGLLGLFVILVGPVAYRSTARRGRSYLMFLIAPVLAIATTVAMFTYGILADGFSTVSRIRQLTWIDSQSENASERVQATYFAGLSPSSGLSFHPDAEVVRYPDASAGSLEKQNEMSAEPLGRIVLEQDTQRLSRSFLPSRQQRQFVVHQPRENLGRLTLRVLSGSTDKSKVLAAQAFVTSELPFALKRFVVRDAAGNHWQAANVEAAEPGKTLTETALTPLASQDVSKIIGNMYNDFRPLAETDFGRRNRSSNRNSNSYMTKDLIDAVNDSFVKGSERIRETSSGTFEAWLNRVMQLDGRLPELHFVAISEVSADVVAAEDADVVDSVRYVFGTVLTTGPVE